MADDKKYIYEITGNRKGKPRIVIPVSMAGAKRLFNFGTEGPFERVIEAQEDGTPERRVKVYVPNQEILETFYKTGKQKLVTRVDEVEKKRQEDALKKAEEEWKKQKEEYEANNPPGVNEDNVVDPKLEKINDLRSKIDSVKKSNKTDAEKKTLIDALEKQIKNA